MTTNKFYINVPVRPEPQARPRANFKNKHAYSTHPDFYHVLVYHVRQKWVYSPFQGALRLCVRFCYKRPATRRFEIYGEGNRNLSVADVDGDGKDEIIYGSACIDDNGKLIEILPEIA